jgi:hypothetical protein
LSLLRDIVEGVKRGASMFKKYLISVVLIFSGWVFAKQNMMTLAPVGIWETLSISTPPCKTSIWEVPETLELGNDIIAFNSGKVMGKPQCMMVLRHGEKTWTPLELPSDMPELHDHYLETDKDLLWIYGREKDSKVWRGWIYNGTTSVWKETASLGEEDDLLKWAGKALFVEGRVYLFDCWKPQRTFVYDAKLDVWDIVTTPTHPSDTCYRAPMIWTGSKLVLWDGENNEVNVFDPLAKNWVNFKRGAAERVFHSTVVWTGQHLLVYGGSVGMNNKNHGIKTGFLFDIKTGSSQELPESPTALNPYTSAWTGDRLLVWGKNEKTGGHEGYILDPQHQTWLTLNSQNGPRNVQYRDYSSFLDNRLFVWGAQGDHSWSLRALHSF